MSKKSSVKKNQGSKKIPFVTAAMKCNWKMSKADGRDSGTAWILNVPAQRINPTNSEPPTAPGQHRGCPRGQGSLQGHPPCRASRQGGVDDVVVVNAEHVHATVLKDTSGTRTLVRFHCIASDQPTWASSKCPPAFQIRHCPGKTLCPHGFVRDIDKHKYLDNSVFPKSFLLPFIWDIWLLPRQALTGTMPSGYTKEVALNSRSSH